MLDYWLWDLVGCMRHEEEKGCSGSEVLPPCLKGGA